jgi:hypothetical protein
LIFGVFNATFSYIMATSFSGGRSWREPPTMGKQLVNFITCGCKFTKPGANYSKENNFETNPTFGVSCV